MHLRHSRALGTWVLALTSFSTLACEASAGFRPNTEAIVQATVVEEMRVLGEFITKAQIGGPYIASPLSFITSTAPLGIPCDLPTGAADTNGNGIPDDLRHIFTQANCPVLTQGVLGEIRVQDLGGPWSVRVTYNQLIATSSSTAFGVERTVNGTIELRQTSDTSVEVKNNTTTDDRVIGGLPTDVISRNNNLTFTQYGPVTTDINGITQALPRRVSIAGSIVRAGTLVSDADTVRMAISTTTPLSQTTLFCAGFFSTGELDVRVTGSYTSTVGIRFSC